MFKSFSKLINSTSIDAKEATETSQSAKNVSSVVDSASVSQIQFCWSQSLKIPAKKTLEILAKLCLLASSTL